MNSLVGKEEKLNRLRQLNEIIKNNPRVLLSKFKNDFDQKIYDEYYGLRKEVYQ
jgi:hypothetical protein